MSLVDKLVQSYESLRDDIKVVAAAYRDTRNIMNYIRASANRILEGEKRRALPLAMALLVLKYEGLDDELYRGGKNIYFTFHREDMTLIKKLRKELSRQY